MPKCASVRSTSADSTRSAIVDAHGPADLADRLYHAAIDRIVRDIFDELSVDLEVIDRQGLQVHERREAAAEVIERKVAAATLEFTHEMHDVAQIRDRGGLGDLEANGAGREVVARQLGDQVFEKALVVERIAGEIQRDRVGLDA